MSVDKNVTTDYSFIGCFHIKLGSTYESFQQAQNESAKYPDGFPAYYSGKFYVLVGNYKSRAEATEAIKTRGISGEAYSASDRCIVVSGTKDGKILFEFDCGDKLNLAIEPILEGQKPLTWFKYFSYYGGFEYSRRSGDKITVVNVVDLEDYICGVLPYEMSNSWPAEALKAQAVCARTYAANHFNAYLNYGFDVSNDVYSQVYRGTNLASPYSDAQVDETRGIYITSDGKLISSMYHSSSGGGTENSENVMISEVPYLRGKTDPYEHKSDNINRFSEWEKSFSDEDFRAVLKRAGTELGKIASITPTYSDSGNVIALLITDVNNKTATFEKNKCYNFSCGYLRLNSVRYEVNISEDGTIKFSGRGWGHSIGMSQFGAYAMAKYFDFTYDQIISFYYDGVNLARGTNE
ncbi:MAG: SpoIID/LytB domain-containing protein [Ruminococcaceae bacterium]|nr:SpoIID/LytB domain-containing protein [Oscillospiraceae bacterium]